ncbi:MAG TPA: hypothetical protein VF275_07630 [Gammaproteobacteria bacterium]
MNARGFWRLLGALLAGALLVSCASTPQSEPGDTGARTLSPAEVDGLLLGRGMGMAAAAEINGYPGPQHVLDLKDELDLTPDQRFATSRLIGLVQGRARALGQRIVDAERRLDADMAAGNLSSDQVRARLETIAALRAQLRFTHIHAHIEQQKILTPEQIRRYYELRGRDVMVAAPTIPPAPTEPLTLPASTTASPAPVAAPGTPAVIPVPTPSAEPVTAPVAEPSPEPAEPVPSEPETPPLPEAAQPLTPGMLDALPDAQPVEAMPAPTPVTSPAQSKAEAVEPQPATDAPAYPLTPIGEQPPPPPPLLPEEEAPQPKAENVEPEPTPDTPAYPLTPIGEEPPSPPPLLPEEEPPAMTPGMQDAMEFAEPIAAEETEAEPEVHIAPLEDDALPELEPVDSEEPATVDLDN